MHQTEFILSSSMTIDSIEMLVSSLKDKIVEIEQPTEFVIDASKVEVVTTPGAQMIVALSRLLDRCGGKLTVKEPTEVFCKAFGILGLSENLNSWGVNNV